MYGINYKAIILLDSVTVKVNSRCIDFDIYLSNKYNAILGTDMEASRERKMYSTNPSKNSLTLQYITVRT